MRSVVLWCINIKSSSKHDISTRGRTITLSIILSVFLDIVWGEQVELVGVVVGPLRNVTAEFLIVLRNVRSHWKPLGLTAQGLISSRPCFLGCLICNTWSLIFLRLFENSSCNFVGGEEGVCNRFVAGLSPTPGPYGGTGELQVRRGVRVQV